MYHRTQAQGSLPSRPGHAQATHSYRSSAPNVSLLSRTAPSTTTTIPSSAVSSVPAPSTAATTTTSATAGPSTSSHPLSKLPTARLLGHRAAVRSLAWNADGRRLASGSVDKSLRVWVPEKGKTLADRTFLNTHDRQRSQALLHLESTTDLKTSVDYRGHVGEVSCVKWEPAHPERLATCSGLKDDKQLHFWDMRQDKPTNSVDTDGSTIHLTWSPDGETIILSSRYDVVTWIDVKTHQIIKKKVMPTEVKPKSLPGSNRSPLLNKNWQLTPDGSHFYPIFQTNEPIFTHNGKILMTAIEGNLNIADFPSEAEIHQVRISPAMTTVLDLDPRGRYVAAGSNDNLVTLWETDEFCCVSSMGAHEDPIRACRFSHDGQYLATSAAASGSDDKIIISEIPSLSRVHLISTPQPVEALAWHPSKTIMAYAAGENGAIRIFGL